MADTFHDRLQQSGLLEGPVDASAVARWPGWAREPQRVCPSCQSLLAVERQVRAAMSTYRSSAEHLQRRGPPTPEERRARLAARRAVAIDEVYRGTKPMPRHELRFEGSPLELRRTSRGVRVWHPDAMELLVLAAESTGLPRVLLHRQEDTPGVGVDLPYAPGGGAAVLALASAEPLDEVFWTVWMGDAVRGGRLAELVAAHCSDYVHVAEATIPAQLRSSLLRVQDEPLPDAHPAVAALLKRAAAAGRSDDTALAARLYREALELAFTKADRTGQIKAGIGIAYAFKGMGYTDDGDKVLRWVIENHTLDATWANWVCRHMAVSALYHSDLDQAEAWIEESEQLSSDNAEWTLVNRASVHYAREDWANVIGAVSNLVEIDVPLLQRAHAEVLSSAALARVGRLDDARELLGEIAYPAQVPLECRLQWRAAGLVRERGTLETTNWGVQVEEVLSDLSEKDGGVLAAWDGLPILELTDLAVECGAVTDAAHLLRARFVDSERARHPGTRVLGLCSSHRGLRLVSAGCAPVVRRLRSTREQITWLVSKSRDELRSSGGLESCRELGQILFEGDDLEPGPVWVGSDGLLADAPISAVAASILGSADACPHFRDLVGLRQARALRDASTSDIVSFADAQGNLPWAAREVSRSEASLWLRGKYVKRSALDFDAPCGLLHLGVHARREQGVPKLLLADGPLGPLEIGQLSLPGAPVVLLAGCFTAVASTERGVERSLADAFCRAGASAVIATRWPVLDREMHVLVRALIEAWPFDDVPRQVAAVCAELRRQGHPARLWAAPVVY